MTNDLGHQKALKRAQGVDKFIQGEIFDLPDACVVLADPAWPLSDGAASIMAEQDGAMVVVPEPTDEVVLITQTCDLQITDANNRLCQVGPVMDVGETFANEAQRGHRPGFAALPWYSLGKVADLSRITSLERSLLVGKKSLSRPRTASERLHFAETVSRHFTRIALPDPISDVVNRFLRRIRDKHDKNSYEGKCISLIANLRIEANPNLDSESPDLKILVILEASDLPPIPENEDLDDNHIDQLKSLDHEEIAKALFHTTDPKSQREAWTALAERWIESAVDLAEITNGVGSLEIEVLSGDDLSFTRQRNAPELDLAYLSTRAK